MQLCGFSGILLTWDPLGGFEERGARVGGKRVRMLEVGVENRQQCWLKKRERGREMENFRSQKKKTSEETVVLVKDFRAGFEAEERGKKIGRSTAQRDGAWLAGNKGDESKQRLKLEDRKTQGATRSDEGVRHMQGETEMRGWGADSAYFAVMNGMESSRKREDFRGFQHVVPVRSRASTGIPKQCTVDFSKSDAPIKVFII